MRAVRLEDGVDMNRIARAAAAEIEAYVREFGDASGSVLVMSVRPILDAEKENGTAPQRKARSR